MIKQSLQPYTEEKSKWIRIIQNFFTGASMSPVGGSVADIIAAILYFATKDRILGIAQLISALPIVGEPIKPLIIAANSGTDLRKYPKITSKLTALKIKLDEEGRLQPEQLATAIKRVIDKFKDKLKSWFGKETKEVERAIERYAEEEIYTEGKITDKILSWLDISEKEILAAIKNIKHG